MSITTQRNFFVQYGTQFVSVCDKSDIVATDSFKAAVWFMGSHTRSNYLAELLSCVPDPKEPDKRTQLNSNSDERRLVIDQNGVGTPSRDIVQQSFHPTNAVSSVKKFATATQTIDVGLDEQPYQWSVDRLAIEMPDNSQETQTEERNVFSDVSLDKQIATISAVTQSILSDVIEKTSELDVYDSVVRFATTQTGESSELIANATIEDEDEDVEKPSVYYPASEYFDTEQPTRSAQTFSLVDFNISDIDEELSKSKRKRRRKSKTSSKSQLCVDDGEADLVDSNRLRCKVETMKENSIKDKCTIEKLQIDLDDAKTENRRLENALAKDAKNRQKQELIDFERESKFMCDISALKTELNEVNRQLKYALAERNTLTQDFAQLSIHYSQFWNQHQNCDPNANAFNCAELKLQLQELELRARTAESELNATQKQLANVQSESNGNGGENSQADRSNAELKLRLQELELRAQTAESELNATQLQLAELNVNGGENSRADRSRSNLRVQPEKQKSFLDRLSNVFNPSKEQVTDGDGSHPRNKEADDNLSIQLKNAIAERDKSVEEMMEIQNKLENARNDLEHALSEAKSAKKYSYSLKEENEMLYNEIDQLKNALTACVAQSKTLENQVATKDVSYMKEMVTKQTTIDSLNNSNEMLRSGSIKIDSMMEQINSLEAMLREKEKEISRLHESVTKLSGTLEQKTTECDNLTESIRLMKKSNQSLIERTDSQMETMQSLHESNEKLSTLLRTSKSKVQQLEKDIKQTVVDKNVLAEVKNENEKLRKDGMVLKDRIQKVKSNDNVKANKIATLQSENKYLLASKTELLKDAKKLEESLLEIQLENHIQSVMRNEVDKSMMNAVTKSIKSNNIHIEKDIRQIVDDLTHESSRLSHDNARRQSKSSIAKESKQFKNQTNASIYCSDLPLDCKDELIRLCKTIIETHCMDALSLDELRLLHEYVYIAGLRKQNFKFPCPTVDLRSQQMQVDQLKEKLNSAKVKIAQLKEEEEQSDFVDPTPS